MKILSLNGAGKQLGPVKLYFGCRHQAQDFIYRSELEAFRREGTLRALSTAFSRDGAQKDYVQVLLSLSCDRRAPAWAVGCQEFGLEHGRRA